MARGEAGSGGEAWTPRLFTGRRLQFNFSIRSKPWPQEPRAVGGCGCTLPAPTPSPRTQARPPRGSRAAAFSWAPPSGPNLAEPRAGPEHSGRPVRPLARVACAPSTAAGQAPSAPPAAGASGPRMDVTEGAQGPCLQLTCPVGSALLGRAPAPGPSPCRPLPHTRRQPTPAAAASVRPVCPSPWPRGRLEGYTVPLSADKSNRQQNLFAHSVKI